MFNKTPNPDPLVWYLASIAFSLGREESNYPFPKETLFMALFRKGCMQPASYRRLHVTPMQPPNKGVVYNALSTGGYV